MEDKNKTTAAEVSKMVHGPLLALKGTISILAPGATDPYIMRLGTRINATLSETKQVRKGVSFVLQDMTGQREFVAESFPKAFREFKETARGLLS